MKPLILIVIFSTAVYAKPGVFNLPTSTAAPAIIDNLPTSTVSIPPNLLVQNAGIQVGEQPVVNIGGHSQGIKLTQPQISLTLGNPSLNIDQLGLNGGQTGLGFVYPGLSFSQLGLTQSGLSFAQPAATFTQPGIDFGGQILSIGEPSHGLGSGINPIPLAPIAPTVASAIGSTLEAAVKPTVSSTLGLDLAPPVPSTIAPPLLSTITPPVQPTLSPPLDSVNAPVITSASPASGDLDFNQGSSLGNAPSDAVVHKHVYVYVAPEEPEVIPPPKPVVLPPPHVHYKIIFVKAPSPPKPRVPVIPVLSQNKEKTIVYVLAKKPEEQPEIRVQTPPPTQPSKPEVYFIRYHTRTESVTEEIKEKEPPVKIDIRGSFPDVSVTESGLTGIARDLNEASLTGGSALSTAVNESPNSLQVSTTPIPRYGVPSHK